MVPSNRKLMRIEAEYAGFSSTFQSDRNHRQAENVCGLNYF